LRVTPSTLYEYSSIKFKILDINRILEYIYWNIFFPQTIEVKQEPPDEDDMIEIHDDAETRENSVSILKFQKITALMAYI